jgi:hypothetical protein
MLGTRTLISLSQFLALQDQGSIELMLEKCGIMRGFAMVRDATEVLECLRRANDAQRLGLIDEICHSTRMLRAAINPKYNYDERWSDLGRCLLLDGYRITGDYVAGYQIVAIDLTIAGAAAIEDDLSAELRKSTLADREEIVQLLENSANDFRKQPPDFNGALTSARVSLETIAKNIAAIHRQTTPLAGDPSKFGAIVAYLNHQAKFLDDKEEQGITGIYAFVSPGAHVPVGFTEEEVVRLGRSMIAAICYFLIKKHNG